MTNTLFLCPAFPEGPTGQGCPFCSKPTVPTPVAPTRRDVHLLADQLRGSLLDCFRGFGEGLLSPDGAGQFRAVAACTHIPTGPGGSPRGFGSEKKQEGVPLVVLFGKKKKSSSLLVSLLTAAQCPVSFAWRPSGRPRGLIALGDRKSSDPASCLTRDPFLHLPLGFPFLQLSASVLRAARWGGGGDASVSGSARRGAGFWAQPVSTRQAGRQEPLVPAS